MAQRKLQQEVDRCFKRVQEGIGAFDQLYEKIQQTSNPSQKEKLEDSLKREIKKLQRQRDMIKAWAAGGEIKDKKPLIDHRKAIETQMERFKAVEKEMKTKAYSKEGLLASQKMDPKDKERVALKDFLSECVSRLEQQIEMCEAECESLTATLRRGKKDSSKAERVAEVERQVERHKWHITKLEVIMRLLENGQLDVESVTNLKDDIKYYVDSNQDPDFAEDESLYDELNLDEENAEELFGIGIDNDRMSSQDTQSVQDDYSDVRKPETQLGPAGRRPSAQIKSPMPAPAALYTPSVGSAVNTPAMSHATLASTMKPAPPPVRPAGELKYASAAAAAAANDKGVGIAPLPPPPAPPGLAVPNGNHASPSGAPGLPPPNAPKQPSAKSTPAMQPAVPILPDRPAASSIPPTPALEKNEAVHTPSPRTQPAIPQTIPETTPMPKSKERSPSIPVEPSESQGKQASSSQQQAAFNRVPTPTTKPPTPALPPVNQPNAFFQGSSATDPNADSEPIFHLPKCLQDLLPSYQSTKSRLQQQSQGQRPMGDVQRSVAVSMVSAPQSLDAEKPRHYKPQTRYNVPQHYPQEIIPSLEDPELYRKVDADVLFYVFYYRQGTYAQYLAAKELKRQSWRFHKLYHTWFQRHEEPKLITEEFEQGAYRFFDYESTWMNRRKSDFQFIYKFLEDEL